MENYNWKRNSSYSHQQNSQRRFNNFRQSRPSYSGSSSNYNFDPYRTENRRQNNPRSFKNFTSDNRNHRRNNFSPYERPISYNHSNKHTNRRKEHYEQEENIVIPQSPLDMKIERLINAVKSQNEVCSQIIFMRPSHENENAVNILQNALVKTNVLAAMNLNEENDMYELTLNNEKFAETKNIATKKVLKSSLFQTAFEYLKKKCFYIISKQNYEEVTTGTDSTQQTKKEEIETQTTNTMAGSKAHLMMLKMGWGGKGLGANEQGDEKTVAEKMTRNITKEGLGNANIMTEVENILKEFAHSMKVSTLVFDSSFSKEERAFIHKLSGKFNLKSKSVGKDEDRRITISKKIEKWDLIKTLLREDGLENDAYKLVIPEDFKHIWEEK